ncbi:MAG: 30S ribosomal protein S2 [Planctomycetota bacterium]|nr:30S ribosomal protein S2 [Planctomycetota bacterium]
MASSLVQDLIEAGIHFGQRTAGWNPKMSGYIYNKRNGIHVIDVKETIKGLLLAKRFITKIVAEGKDVCFVGTKRQAKTVLEARVPDVKMHWVTERWLGGTLTNFRTIRLRLKRLEELEAIEAKDNYASYSKKMESQLRREQRKIKRNLDGLRTMEKLPGCIVVIDVRHEVTALKEARKLGVPTIALIDTDGDPDMVDIPIPGNDDSMRAIDVIVRELCMAVADGKQMRQASDQAAAAGASGLGGGSRDRGDGQGDSGPRRSRRSQYRADDAGTSDGAPQGAGASTGA